MGRSPRWVICVDTGEIYKSFREAKKQVASSIWYNLRYGVPYKGKRYEYYDPQKKPVKTGKEILEDYELYWQNYFQAFHDQHPEYNSITRTMSAKEYANYLKSRKERSL